MAMVTVDVDPSDVIEEISTEALIAELAKRGKKHSIEKDELPIGVIVQSLKLNDCPPELVKLVEDWLAGRLNLVDCMALVSLP